ARRRRRRLAARRPRDRGRPLRRGDPRGVPRVHDVDDHGPRAGDPARGAPPTAPLPPRAARARAAAPRLPGAAPVGRRRPRDPGRLGARRRPQHRSTAHLRPHGRLARGSPAYDGSTPMSTATTRGFWPLRDLPVVFWLVATAVIALVHPFV